MNRRAKRNKYKKLQKELEQKIKLYKYRLSMRGFDVANSESRKIRMLSCYRDMLDWEQAIVPEYLKENYKAEVVKQLAEEILKRNELLKITDCGSGYRYDILVVEQ